MTKWVAWLVAVILFFTMTLGVINTYNNYQRTLKETEEHPEHYRKHVVDIDEDREYYEDFDAEGYKTSLIDALDDGFKRLSGTEVFLIVLSLLQLRLYYLVRKREERPLKCFQLCHLQGLRYF